MGSELIGVSGGGIATAPRLERAGPNYRFHYAERFRAESECEIAVGAVGGITTLEQAEAIVADGRADLAIVGREHLRDQCFPLRAARALDATDEIEGPLRYRRAFGF